MHDASTTLHQKSSLPHSTLPSLLQHSHPKGPHHIWCSMPTFFLPSLEPQPQV
uniref:Uncharacterized protein n=1 Tax=Nelumbo nucifera TaxID=4432 RepID=A0A822XVL9_NELNU|nr:TPA_asm: hypothetical protein HUJ06_024489 [Nelumbo nucifera]